MNNVYKLYKKSLDPNSSLPCMFYIIRNEKEISTFQLDLPELFFVGILNKVSNFRELFEENQGITCYSDLKMLLDFIENNRGLLPMERCMQVLKALDVNELYSHMKDFAKKGKQSEEYVLMCLTKAEMSAKCETNKAMNFANAEFYISKEK